MRLPSEVLSIAAVVTALSGCETLPTDRDASAATYPVSAQPACTDRLPGADAGHPVTSFDAIVLTRDAPNAVGTSQIWIDLGFAAWPLPKDSTSTGAPVRFAVPLTNAVAMEDLYEVRLEKKGALGFTGAWDIGGTWQPESVSLLVDGQEIGRADAPDGLVLNSKTRAWRILLRDLDAGHRMAFGLRDGLFGGTSTFDGAISAITTPFKRAGISGWQTGPLPGDPPLYGAVVGVLRETPSPGLDGFVSLDLEVEKLGVAGHWYCRSPGAVRQPRYVRVEYYRYHDGEEDRRFKTWREDQRFFIRGDVRWDTDRQGFYEIHPRTASDVATLPN
jgi:hypothetical protein